MDDSNSSPEGRNNDVEGTETCAAAVPKRHKKVDYVENSSERSKIDSRTRTSLEKKLNEWYSRTKMPAILVTLKGGQPYFSCPKDLETSFESFFQNPDVRQAYCQSVDECFGPTSPGVEIPILDDYSKFSVSDLRTFVIQAVKTQTNEISWRRRSTPSWWPTDVQFMDPNNAGKKQHHHLELVKVMNSYGQFIINQNQEKS